MLIPKKIIGQNSCVEKRIASELGGLIISMIPLVIVFLPVRESGGKGLSAAATFVRTFGRKDFFLRAPGFILESFLDSIAPDEFPLPRPR